MTKDDHAQLESATYTVSDETDATASVTVTTDGKDETLNLVMEDGEWQIDRWGRRHPPDTIIRPQCIVTGNESGLPAAAFMRARAPSDTGRNSFARVTSGE